MAILSMLLAFGSPINSAQKKILLGDERVNEYLPLLEGKRVGVFSNQSGIVGDYSEGLLCLPVWELATAPHSWHSELLKKVKPSNTDLT